jgi:uncharacterized protein
MNPRNHFLRPRPLLAEPLHRLATRWRNGGVEEYWLGVGESPRYRRWQKRLLRTEITRHRIRLRGLDPEFGGVRIVQLTDIHHGLYFPVEALAQTVEIVNRLEPDIVVVTGDFVTYSRTYIESAAELLGGVHARLGVFAVLGNHDFRVSADQIARELRRSGLEMLRNRNTAITYRRRTLHLAGVDDWNYGADLNRALRGVPKNAPTILLSHHPAIIQAASERGVGLVLAGHTHGGQVNLPVFGTIYGRSPDQTRFKMGWARLGPTQIYVSRGIGTVVLPVRYRCSPEIPQFTLETAH